MKHSLPIENNMTFTENRHGNQIIETLQKQRESERFCDIIFLVGDKQFPAHRCIVIAFSPYLDSILKARKVVKEQFTISCTTSDAFDSLLVYMYSGTVKINKENLTELLKLANKLHMEQLKNYCAEYLEQCLNTTNCLTVFEMAVKYDLIHLKNLTCSYIGKNLCDVIEGEEIMYLSLPKLENFLQNPHWKLKNEEIFSLLTCWVYHDVTTRENNYRSLLTFISWSDIYPQVVNRMTNSHPLFSTSEMCLSFILDILEEENLLQNSSYESLYQLKEATLSQDVRIVEDSDKFFNLAISTAINEFKDDHSFLPRDKNLESLFNETNVDRYLLEKDFNWRQDIVSNDIQNDVIINDQTEHHVQTLEAESDQTVYQTHYRQQNLVHNSNENFHIVEKSKDFDADYCNYYNCQNDFNLGIVDFHESELHSKSSDHSEGSNKMKALPYFPESFNHEEEKETANSVKQNCCHYLHENSENCPAITNKKSYMNHKYKINHPSDNCDILIHKKVYPSNYRKYFANSINDSLNFKTGCGADEEAVSILPTNKSFFHIEKSNNYNNKSLVEGPVDSEKFTLGRKEINSSCDKIPESDIFNALHEDGSYACVEKTFENAKATAPQTDFLSLSQDDYPKDMSLPHSNCLSEKHFRMSSDIENFSSSNDEEIKFISVIQYMEDDQKEMSLSEVVPSNNTCCNNAAKDLQDEICSSSLQSNEQTKLSENKCTSDKFPESKTNESCKQTMKQKVMQKYWEGKQRCLSGSSIEQGVQIIVNENIASKNTLHNDDDVISDKKVKLSKTTKQTNNIKPQFNDAKVCDVCSASFNVKKPYFAHMKEHFPGPPHKCDSCNSNFQRIYHLLDHRLTHSENKPFKCQKCPFSTLKMSNLKDHMMGHSDDAKLFECTECGQKFCRKQHLDKHYTKHTKDRPFICDTCGWTGKTKDSLLLHSRVHSGDMYSCQYSDCAYRTAKMSHLKEHMQYHSKSRPFSCDTCNYRFMTNSHLLRHKRKHHDPSSCQCPHCDYSTSRIDLLKIHIKRLHLSLKQSNIVKQRKPQLKKKDAMIAKHCLSEPGSQIRSSDNKVQQFPVFSDFAESSTISLESSLPANLNYSIHASTASSCSFDDANADPDNALMIVSEIEGSVRHSLSPYGHNSYLDQSISDSLDCDETQNQYSLPFKNSFSYTISNMD